jgi:hypothetical protein
VSGDSRCSAPWRHHHRRDVDRGIPSTKNKAQKRDPEMRSSKKGNQWYFGVKAQIGVDVTSGLGES